MQADDRGSLPLASSCKGAHVPQELSLTGVRWSGAYPVRYRHGEERMAERGVSVEHATIQRWGVKSSPLREEACPRRTRPGWSSGRMDATDSKGKGEGPYVSRAGAQAGQPMAFRLTEPRETAAACRVRQPASRRHGRPAPRPLAGRAAQAAALTSDTEAEGPAIARRQGQEAKHGVAQDQRAVQRVPRAMLGFKSLAAAQAPRGGMARRHTSKTRQRRQEAGDEGLTAVAPCSTLAA